MFHLTPKEEAFVEATDPLIVEEIIENNMLSEEIPYFEFYAPYQARHKEIYGVELTVELK